MARRGTRKRSANTGRCTSQVTIDMLPDVALLEIFECYIDDIGEYDIASDVELTTKAWRTLVHVCRNWRAIVLGSPRRLDLQLLCTEKTPVKDKLAIWPPLPIVIEQYVKPRRMRNIIAALKHNDRIRQISLLEVSNSQLEQVWTTMQQPFPALMDLTIYQLSAHYQRGSPTVVPESFLGGSAPRLEYVELERIPFPGLPKLLLSATGLISLHIWEVPHSGYISPDAMVSCLSTLTRLEFLTIGFEFPASRPVRESRRPRVSEYLEDLVARIDAPLLDTFKIWFFHQLIFDTPQLVRFVARTPNSRPPVDAHIAFCDRYVEVTTPTFPRKFELAIRCRQQDWQLSSMSSLTQIFSSSLPGAFISTVERLYVSEPKYVKLHWQDDIEDNQWLEILLPFTAVNHLYLSRGFTSRIVPALKELPGEVLPSLRNLFLEDPPEPVQEAIGKFIAARQLSGHPVAVSLWDRTQDNW